MAWRDDVRRANETLDWIEQRQGPLKPDGYARVETTVGQVRAMAEVQDDARIAEIGAEADERDARIKTLENDLEHALASVGAFRQAIETIFEKADAHEVDQGGMIVTYVLPCGPLHRAIGLARGTDAGGKLLAERDECQRMLEDLTPGGSEFYRNPMRCRNWVQDRLSGAHASTVKAVQERDALAARLAAAESALASALEDLLCRDELSAVQTLEAALAGSREQAWRASCGAAPSEGE